jgi:hypothetical protein
LQVNTLHCTCSYVLLFTQRVAEANPTKGLSSYVYALTPDMQESRINRLSVTSLEFMLITWIGPAVGIMTKARVGPQREELITILPGLQFFMGASEHEDVDRMNIAAKLLASGGAHKPTHYIFGPDQEVALTDMSIFKTYI